MHRRILAFDFDGTLAADGSVPPALQKALASVRAAGFTLFLVTGRRHGSVELGLVGDLFDGIVWENGAVLCHSGAREVFLPFGHLDAGLAEALKVAGVPVERGSAILSTWRPHEEAVWRVLSAWGGDPVVVHNKDALMILPPGASKGSGLERLLGICGLSRRNLVSFGDAENDLPLLRLGELGVAVADAVPALQAVADLVTTQPGPDGVLEALETYWLAGNERNLPLPRRECLIPLGEDEAGQPICMPGGRLAGANLGVFGDPNSGKSWVTGLLAEGMHHAGYQVLLIDPEGDYRALRALPGIVAFEGNR
jgi:hydroxymethylpyrimidine pyrophosphatase-like HAD family hydrolase